MKIVQLLLMMLGFAATNANAQTPTVVVGEAATAQGNINAVVVEQPENAGNPLGNPLPEQQTETPQAQATPAVVPDKGLENKDTSSVPTKNPSDDFQNTLLEANGRVYDVQSYPQADLPKIENSADPQTLYSPNVNP